MSECSGTFYWLTRAVCPTVADQCTLAYNGHVYDLSVLSRQQGSWNLTDAQRNTLVFFRILALLKIYLTLLKYRVLWVSECFML